MKTTFVLRICCEDVALADSLACEGVQLIDELEQKLSRYHEGGDVHRINHMGKGQTLYISEEAHECLLIAMEASYHTGGLFNPTLGAMIEHVKTRESGPMPLPEGQLMVDPERAVVTCEEPGRIIDLGGIGKGYALDQLGRMLDGWEVEGALFSAGASTHLAVGDVSWPIELISEHDRLCLMLKGEALSASGTTIQGAHIMNPEALQDEVVPVATRVWARSASGAFSDAWSTALLLMEPEEIEKAPSAAGMLSAAYLEVDGYLKEYA